jgi:hypothetical protein
MERRKYVTRTSRGTDPRQRRPIVEYVFHAMDTDDRPLCRRWIDVERRRDLAWSGLDPNDRCEGCALLVATRSVTPAS